MTPEEDSVVEEEVDSSYSHSIGRYVRNGIDTEVSDPFCIFVELLPTIVEIGDETDDV